MAENGSWFLFAVNTGTEDLPVFETVACQRDATISEADAGIDASCKDAREQRILPGRYSSTISCESLYIPDDETLELFKTAIREGEMLYVAVMHNNVLTERAKVRTDARDLALPDQDVASISMSFTVDGAWEPILS